MIFYYYDTVYLGVDEMLYIITVLVILYLLIIVGLLLNELLLRRMKSKKLSKILWYILATFPLIFTICYAFLDSLVLH